jgi:hypothetical protein
MERRGNKEAIHLPTIRFDHLTPSRLISGAKARLGLGTVTIFWIESMSEVDGATLIARSLKNQGIDHLFGVVGFPVGPIAAGAQKEGLALST